MWHDELQLKVLRGRGWVISIIPGDSLSDGRGTRRPKIMWLLNRGIRGGETALLDFSIREKHCNARFINCFYLALEKFLNVVIKTRTDPDSKKLNVSPTCTSRKVANNSAVTWSWLPGFVSILFVFFVGYTQESHYTGSHMPKKQSSGKLPVCATVSIPAAHLTHRRGIVHRHNRAAPRGIHVQSKQFIFWVLSI